MTPMHKPNLYLFTRNNKANISDYQTFARITLAPTLSPSHPPTSLYLFFANTCNTNTAQLWIYFLLTVRGVEVELAKVQAHKFVCTHSNLLLYRGCEMCVYVCVCVCVCVRGLVDVMGTKCSHTIISK